nr:MAG TPA: hypothetical protein [Caudoviricetes sp.]
MEIEFVDTKTGKTVLKWDTPDKCNASNSEVLRHKHRMYNGYIFARHAFYNVQEAKVYLFMHQYPERYSFSDEEYFGRLCAIGRPWVRQLPCWHEMVRAA